MRSPVLPVLVLAIVASGANARAATPGALTQLPGPAGCLADQLEGCTQAFGLDAVNGIAVSPDGAFVYTTASSDLGGDHTVTTFARDAISGALTPNACISESGRAPCTKAHGLEGAFDLMVSPDGANLYVAATGRDEDDADGSLAVFARDLASGGLTQLPGVEGCVSAQGRDACAKGRALAGVSSVALSPDGATLYATTFNANAVLVFARDRTTGTLTQLDGRAGCIREHGGFGCAAGRGIRSAASIVVSPDGRNAYAAANLDSEAVSAYARDPATGRLRQLPGRRGCLSERTADGCATGRGLGMASHVAISPDGNNVYAAAFGTDSIAVLTRNHVTGRLRQAGGKAGCFARSRIDGCTPAHALGIAAAVTVAPDGRDVYVAGESGSAIIAFARGPGGRLTPLNGLDYCVGLQWPCRTARGVGGAYDVTVAPDGRNVYAVGIDAGAVAVFARLPFQS